MRNSHNLKRSSMSLPRLPAAREVSHFLNKLISTVQIISTLFMARMFGKYVRSIGGYGFDYAVYRWRGKTYAFPTTTMEEDQ